MSRTSAGTISSTTITLDMISDAAATSSDDAAGTWRCPKCADDLATSIATNIAASIPDEAPCPSCGRSLREIEWPRRLRRIALIVFGLGLQAMSGAMFFLIPPGGSIGAWLLYLGLGLVGFLHMFMGFELTRRDRGSASSRTKSLARHSGEEADLPLHAMRCPRCEHCLIDAIRRNMRRCPNCDSHFTLRDLGIARDDPAGEPITLAPNELRLGGATIVAAFVVGMVLLAMVMAGLLVSSPGGP